MNKEIIKIGNKVYRQYMDYGIIDNVDYYHDRMYYISQFSDKIHEEVEDAEITLAEGVKQMQGLLDEITHYAIIHQLMAKKI